MASCSKCGCSMSAGTAFKNCEDCRRKAKAKEDAAKQRRKENADREVKESSGSKKMCSRCKYARDIQLFKTGDQEFNSCLSCRENSQRNDVKRKDSEARKEWLKNAPDYWKAYRCKKRMEDRDGFLKHNAEVMKAWREKNPEKWATIQEKAKRGDNIRGMKQQAEVKGIPWELSEEYALQLSHMPCFYCTGFSPSKINGVGRLDCLKGYLDGNVKPCCNTCSMSKGTLDPESFVSACEAIHAYITGAKGPSQSGNGLMEHGVADYTEYTSRALKKEMVFELSEEKFLEIKTQPCYLCGRLGSHSGIDRKDNAEGYTLENSFPCCGECNYLKRDYKYEDFVDMVAKIASNAEAVRCLLPSDIQRNCNSRSHVNVDKLKGDALKEHQKKKREERLEATQEKYRKKDPALFTKAGSTSS